MKRVIFGVIMIALIAGNQSAEACGAFFVSTEETQLADMSDQRVLLIYSDEGIVHHLVQVAYEGKPSSFAWVYPFPAQPEIAEASESIFSQLDSLTRPNFTITTDYGSDDEGGGCIGCLPGAAMGSKEGYMDASADTPVTVWNTGQVGIFDYAIITAVTVDDMLNWLNDNGYNAPSSANSVLEHYVQLGWYFVAMKINAESVPTMTSKTSVLRFTYPYSSMVYPLYMSSISSSSNVGVIIYVVAGHRIQTSSSGTYVTREIPRNEVKATSSNSTNYDELFSKIINDAGGRAFITEYATDEIEELLRSNDLLPYTDMNLFLTRLRTNMRPSLMDNDVIFSFAPSDEELNSSFHLYYPPKEDAGVGYILPLFLLLSFFFFLAKIASHLLNLKK